MLELTAVDAGYGTFQALFSVSLEVRLGEAVAVIGPNGAGKTTMMRVISGLIRPMRGRVGFDGVDLVSTPAHRILELGIAHVPENRRLFPRMTVEDNLRMGAYAPSSRPKFRERLAVVYDLFPRLLERRHQFAGTLSGGEQQMCAIGRALMSEPKLLLLDEPSAGLSPIAAETLFATIRAINRDGIAIAMVEQNATQALAIAHRATILVDGRNNRDGAAAALAADPEIRRIFLGATPSEL